MVSKQHKKTVHKPIKMVLKLNGTQTFKPLSSGENLQLKIPFVPKQPTLSSPAMKFCFFFFPYCFHFITLLLNSLKCCDSCFFITSATKTGQDTNTSLTGWRRGVTVEDFGFFLMIKLKSETHWRGADKGLSTALCRRQG